MIFKIHQSSSDVNAAIRYNEKKMDGEEGIRPEGDAETEAIENGHILVTRNLAEGTSLADEFEKRKFESIKKRTRGQITNVSFHMSVNPSETDRPLSEKETVSLIDEVMNELGYGTQPYRIYEHTDIERKHYHVVSCRIDENGKKINADFEILRLRKILLSLQDKYGFSVVLNDYEKNEMRIREQEGQLKSEKAQKAIREKPAAKKEKAAGKEKKIVYPFSRNSSEPVTEQMKNIIEDSLNNWYFSTFEQYQALLLRRYNLLLFLQSENDKLVINGTDRDGNKITPPVNEDILGTDLINRLNEKIARENMRNRIEQRKRLEKLAVASAGLGKSYEDFKRLMEAKGVYVVISWTESGDPFGVTYIDRATHCIFKGSETAASLSWLKEKCKEKGWTMTKDKQQLQLEKSNMGAGKRNISQVEKAHDKKPEAGETLSNSQKRTGGRKPGRLKDEHVGRVGYQEGSSKQAGDGHDDDIWNNDDDKPVELIR